MCQLLLDAGRVDINKQDGVSLLLSAYDIALLIRYVAFSSMVLRVVAIILKLLSHLFHVSLVCIVLVILIIIYPVVLIQLHYHHTPFNWHRCTMHN